VARRARFSFFGDKGVLIHFGEIPDEAASKQAISLSKLIEKEKICGVIDQQVSYNSIVIYYDPLKIQPRSLIDRLRDLEKCVDEIALRSPKVYEIPTLYGGEYGPDLEYVAHYHGITTEEVIRIHTKEPLLVHRMGLNVHNLVPEKLVTPRRRVPRLKVFAGDVGIGNKQTGPYVIDCPGGWNIIGRTPLKLYDPQRNPPFLFEIGDYVHYRAIDEREFKALEGTNRGFANSIKSKSVDDNFGVFRVIEPGLLSTIQDIGRFNYRRFGIPAGGPMDDFSFRIGNILVGNDEYEAALEVTVSGPTMMALEDTAIAITGGDLCFTIGKKPVPMWEVIEIRKGDLLTASKVLRPLKGCRAYISVAGGIDVPMVMGSKSTSVPYHIGGIDGRALAKGDVIKRGRVKIGVNSVIGRKTSREINSMIGGILPNPNREATVLSMIMGPFEDHFTSDAINRLLDSEYTITPESDRAGYRLEGPDIKHNSKGPDIITTGHVPGAIQVPGSFKPIIFLHERSAGGYAIIATIISPDLCGLAQLIPGCKIRFKKVSLEESHTVLKEYERRITRFKSYIRDRE
jgi:antagonist of KipI